MFWSLKGVGQEWVLEILRQGIRDKHCYELCSRRGVFHIILSFFNSPLCDEVAQVSMSHGFTAQMTVFSVVIPGLSG